MYSNHLLSLYIYLRLIFVNLQTLANAGIVDLIPEKYNRRKTVVLAIM